MAVAFLEVVEGIRATIATHAQAQDDGRTDILVALYHPQGAIEIPGFGTVEGTDALRRTFATWAPTLPQRHAVVNTLVHEWNQTEAYATSDALFVQKTEAGWAIQAVVRYHDQFELVDGMWLIRRRAMEFVPPREPVSSGEYGRSEESV